MNNSNIRKALMVYSLHTLQKTNYNAKSLMKESLNSLPFDQGAEQISQTSVVPYNP